MEPLDLPRQREVIGLVLQVAVPLWLDRLHAAGPQGGRLQALDWTSGAWTTFDRIADRLDPGDPEAHISYRALSRILASLATLPGGVEFVGMTWCRDHARAGRPSESWEATCRECVSRGTTGGQNWSHFALMTEHRRDFARRVHLDGRYR